MNIDKVIENIEKENLSNEEISEIESFVTFNKKFFTKILKVSKKDYTKLDNFLAGKLDYLNVFNSILEEEKKEKVK